MAKTNAATSSARQSTKSRSIAASRPKPTGGFLSAERIEDSESDNEALGKHGSSASPLRRGNGAPSTSTKPPLATVGKASGVAAKKSSTIQKSEDSDDGEDSEESEENEQVGAKAPATEVRSHTATNGVKRRAEEQSSSEDESSDEDDESAQSQLRAKRAKTTAEEPASESTSEEDEESSSEEESEDEDSTSSSRRGSQEGAARIAATPATAQLPIPAPPFEPPAGYVALAASAVDADSPFARQNLAGKQIWHISAPADLPLASLTDLALDAIDSATPVLAHNGMSYVLRETPRGASGAESVMLASSTGAGYERSETPIARRLCFVPHLDLPNLGRLPVRPTHNRSTSSDADGGRTAARGGGTRPQPKGLRMRYRPPGFGKGRAGRIGSGSESGTAEGDDDDDDDEADSSVRASPHTERKPDAKRKQHELDALPHRSIRSPSVNGLAAEPADQSTSASKEKKKKKKKHREAEGPAETTSDGDRQNAGSTVSSQKERSTADDTARKSSHADRNETPEERARRKALKRERKEAKLKAKE